MGLKGEYLLVWKTVDDSPQLSVYKTNSLCNQEGLKHPLAVRKFCSGLANWKAQMLETSCHESDIKVLVCEIGMTGQRRFLIWDILHRTIVKRACMTMQPQRSIDMTQWVYVGAPAGDIVERELPISCWQMLPWIAEEDAYPKFSTKGAWIGAISWCTHSCAITSTDSGVTVWSCALPSEIVINPFSLPIQAIFDKAGHFVIFSDCAILAFAPSFLDPLSQDPTASSIVPRGLFLDELRRGTPLGKAFDVHPSKAIAHAATRRIRDKTSNLGIDELLACQVDTEVVQAEVSSDGLRAAYITAPYDVIRWAYPDDYHPCLTASTLTARKHLQTSTYQGVEATVIPLDDKNINPGRVFLFKCKGEGDGLVLFDVYLSPVAVFVESNLESLIVHLEMDVNVILGISQTKDQQRLLLVDKQSLCILDLEKHTITQRIRYAVFFSQLFKLTKSHKKSLHMERFKGDLDTARRISDHGLTVLLGWDTQNRNSVVVTPLTRHNQCKTL